MIPLGGATCHGCACAGQVNTGLCAPRAGNADGGLGCPPPLPSLRARDFHSCLLLCLRGTLAEGESSPGLGRPSGAMGISAPFWAALGLGTPRTWLSLCPLVLKERVYVALQRQREQCQGRCRACRGEDTGSQRRLVWLLVAGGWPQGSPRPMSGVGVAGCSREADCSAGFFSL